MKRRCLDAKCANFVHYGARGIKVCDSAFSCACVMVEQAGRNAKAAINDAMMRCVFIESISSKEQDYSNRHERGERQGCVDSCS